MRLLNLSIDGLIGFEENAEFLKDAKIGPFRLKDELELLVVDGRVGWTFFKQGVVFFDFSHSNLVIAKDLPVLVDKAGYSLNDFIPIPFELHNCGPVFTIQTSVGAQKFLLDTGATCSIIRDASILREMKSSKSSHITENLRIGESDFGQWTFRLLEYNEQMECDGILGIDFFKKHMICLDFLTNTAYVSRFYLKGAEENRFSAL